MRFHKGQATGYVRRLIALLLFCGLLLPLGQQAGAAAVTYQYDWITDTDSLPTDDQWHDYFIAWEDTGKKGKFWFTDYNWYTADSDSNIDVGGLSWMEYKSQSQLPNTKDKSFTSEQSLGHMQIKYAGKDSDNGNSPKYYIRFSEMSGGYRYVTRWNPQRRASDAEAFTFQDKGDVFHIFINIANQADVYLTRDGNQLETSLSSSSSNNEYPMRLYKRSYHSQNGGNPGFDGDTSKLEGKVKMYEYYWIDTVEELMELTKNDQWQDVMLAWEDAQDDDEIDYDKVWYTKGIWFDDNKVNYEDTTLEYYYYSDSLLGEDGYTSPVAQEFVTKEKVSHFQLLFHSFDKDNTIKGVKDENGKAYQAPVFFMRFQNGQNSYTYFNYMDFVDSFDKVDKSGDTHARFTVELQANEKRKDDDDYYYGSAYFYHNLPYTSDVVLTRKNNRLDVSSWNRTSYWEMPFRIYGMREVEYDGIVQSFTIGAGSTYSVDRHLILHDDVVITVEDGGVLTVDSQLLNNGQIVVKTGGTLIVNEGGYITPFGATGDNGKISLEGGNMLILEDAKVILDEGYGRLDVHNGASVINHGLLMLGKYMDMRNNSWIYNAQGAEIITGAWLKTDRGGVGVMSYGQIRDRLKEKSFGGFANSKAYIVNDGTIYQSSESNWVRLNSSQLRNGPTGTIKRIPVK